MITALLTGLVGALARQTAAVAGWIDERLGGGQEPQSPRRAVFTVHRRDGVEVWTVASPRH